jgi:hypothetical protein
MLPRFDWTISLGTIVHLVVLLTTIVLAWWRTMQTMKDRQEAMYRELDKRIGNGDVSLGQRIALIEQRISDIWESFTREGRRR